MKYFLLMIRKLDTGEFKKAVYQYDTQNEAVQAFHSNIGVAMKETATLSGVAIVVDLAGNSLRKEPFNNVKEQEELVIPIEGGDPIG